MKLNKKGSPLDTPLLLKITVKIQRGEKKEKNPDTFAVGDTQFLAISLCFNGLSRSRGSRPPTVNPLTWDSMTFPFL